MKLNNRKVVSYLVYLFGFILLFIILSKINSYFIQMKNEYFRIYPWEIFIILMNFPIGIYLGLPTFLKELKKSGKWSVNFYVMVLIVLPMTYLSFYWLFPFSYPIPELLTYTKPMFDYGMIVVGYFVMRSFTKD